MPGEKDNKTNIGVSRTPPPPPPLDSSFHKHQRDIVSIINNRELKSEDKLKNYDDISHNVDHDASLDSQIKERLMSMITRAKISSPSVESEQQSGKLKKGVVSDLEAMLVNRKPPPPSVSSGVASDASIPAPSSKQPVRPKGPPAFLAGITGGAANLKKTVKETSLQTESQKTAGSSVQRNLAEAAAAGLSGLRRREKSPDNKPEAAPLSELERKLAARRAKESVATVRDEGIKHEKENEKDVSNHMKPK